MCKNVYWRTKMILFEFTLYVVCTTDNMHDSLCKKYRMLDSNIPIGNCKIGKHCICLPSSRQHSHRQHALVQNCTFRKLHVCSLGFTSYDRTHAAASPSANMFLCCCLGAPDIWTIVFTFCTHTFLLSDGRDQRNGLNLQHRCKSEPARAVQPAWKWAWREVLQKLHPNWGELWVITD